MSQKAHCDAVTQTRPQQWAKLLIIEPKPW